MENGYTRVIGIDPGLEITGVAILDIKSSRYLPVLCDCILTKKTLPTSKRLKQIYESLTGIIREYNPGCLAIEDIFFSANVKTALSVGAARGVAILSGSNNDLEVFEYTPLQVKQAIVGYGRATKKQVKYMLKMILGAKDDFFPSYDDAWDAMGVAICHASMSRFEGKLKEYMNQ